MAVERDSLRGIVARELIYEYDLAAERSQQITVGRISAWMGLPTIAGQTNFRPQMPDRPVSELIANYSEIRILLDEFSEEFPQTGADEHD